MPEFILISGKFSLARPMRKKSKNHSSVLLAFHVHTKTHNQTLETVQHKFYNSWDEIHENLHLLKM